MRVYEGIRKCMRVCEYMGVHEHEYAWEDMGIHGMYGSMREFMGVHMGVCGSAWVCMGVHTWEYVGVHGV